MKKSTLVFLIKRKNGEIDEILLAIKKRGFGLSKYNGVGGKVEMNENINIAAIREIKEEIGVNVNVHDLKDIGLLEFYYEDKEEWNQEVNIFLVENWEGEISESDEMLPKWFAIDQIPYDLMWKDDSIWLPIVLKGSKVNGYFKFNKDGEIYDFNLK